MLTGSVPASLRPQTEGIGEVAIGLAAGAGAPVAGLILAFGDFTTLPMRSGVCSLASLRLGRTVTSSPSPRGELLRRQPVRSSDDSDDERSGRPVRMEPQVALAYQVVGQGPIDLLYMQSSISNVEVNWEHPMLAGFLRELAGIGRLIVADRRGLGCSERFTPGDTPPIETLIDDVLGCSMTQGRSDQS
jgi:hypothetical protein